MSARVTGSTPAGRDNLAPSNSSTVTIARKHQRPQRDTQVNAPVAFFEIASVCEVFPLWLGGMTQEEAGLTLTLVASVLSP
jgi:hypothetical protein